MGARREEEKKMKVKTGVAESIVYKPSLLRERKVKRRRRRRRKKKEAEAYVWTRVGASIADRLER